MRNAPAKTVTKSKYERSRTLAELAESQGYKGPVPVKDLYSNVLRDNETPAQLNAEIREMRQEGMGNA